MGLVSIIIPCYNYGWVLNETLDSLLAQAHQQWECFIVDDGSVDKTGEIALEYVARDTRFHYLRQENQGVSTARNLGLKQAQGEFIQFLDGDDLLATNKLAVQIAFLANHPEVDIVYGDVRYFTHGHPQLLRQSITPEDKSWAEPLQGHGRDLLAILIKQNQLAINAPLLRASLLKRVGMFSPELRYMEDWEFWLRCAIANAYFYHDSSPEMWALVRVHPTSLSQNRGRMLTSLNDVRERLEKALLEIGAEEAIAINRAELTLAKEYSAIYNMQQGNVKVGLKLFWEMATATGRYIFYLRSAFYWLRHQ